ncbi:MAG: tetratricopeptide repeat protein, partial [Gemmatimonas sp.]
MDLGIHFCELCTECRRYALMWPAADVLAAWCEHGAAPTRRLFVQTLRARAVTAQGKLDDALPIVESTLAAARLVKDPLGQAYALFSLAQIALRQGDAGLAIEHAGKSLECFRASSYDGPWTHVYAFLAVAMRGQASPAERRRLLAEGIEANRVTFREVEAANLGLECIEIDLQEGQVEVARQRLATLRDQTEGLSAHEQIRVGVQLAACSVQFASGDHEGAIHAA